MAIFKGDMTNPLLLSISGIMFSLNWVKVERVFAIFKIFCESPQISWAAAAAGVFASSGVTAVAGIICVVGATVVGGVTAVAGVRMMLLAPLWWLASLLLARHVWCCWRLAVADILALIVVSVTAVDPAVARLFAAVGVPQVLLMFSNHKKVKNSKSSQQNSQACVYPYPWRDRVGCREHFRSSCDVTVSSHIFTGNSDQKDPSHWNIPIRGGEFSLG